jgi:hypothetical protein
MPTGPAAAILLRPETVSSIAASMRRAASARPYPRASSPPSSMGAALLEGEADLGRCGLTSHDDASSPTVSGRSEEMTDELAD